LKQPVGSDDSSIFPTNDKEAISTWPHLIYVEGGNTFWLQHCIEKGDYSTLLKNACIGSSGAVYMGKSAGGELFVRC
jgi:peptidase E